jgi:prophage regulatory protein
MQTAENTPGQLRILRLPAVREKTGYPTTTIYDKMKRGEFPRPVELGPHSVGWVESEIDEHLRGLIAKRDAGAWQQVGDVAAKVVEKVRP